MSELTFQIEFVQDPDTPLVHVLIAGLGVICETVQAAGKPWQPVTAEELAAAGWNTPGALPLCPLCFNPEVSVDEIPVLEVRS